MNRELTNISMGESRPSLMFNDTSVGRAQLHIATRRFLRVNDALCRLTGYDEAELLALRLDDLTHQDDIKQANELFDRFEGEEDDGYQIKKRYICKDSSTIWVLETANFIYNEERKPVYIILFVQDITKRKERDTTLDADFKDAELLNQLSRLSIDNGDFQRIYDEIAAAIITLLKADAGMIHILDEATQEFILLAAQGISPEKRANYNRIGASSDTSFSQAVNSGGRVIVDTDGHRESSSLTASYADYYTMQSTPLVTRRGRCIGTISSFWLKPHIPTERELRFLDLLVRQTTDLIEQQQSQTTLQSNEAHLLAIFRQATVGLSELSLEGIFERANDELCRILNRPREEILSLGVADLTHPEDMRRSILALKNLLTTGEPQSLDKRYRRPDGSTVWANSSLSLLRDSSGHPTQILAVTADLTERKQAEVELRQSEEQLRIAIEAAQLGTWVWDLTTNEVFCNERHFQMLGLNAGTNIERPKLQHGQVFFDYVHPEDRDALVAQLQDAIQNDQTFKAHFRVVREDGETRWMDGYGQVIELQNGVPTRMSGVLLDVTERKQAEIDLQRAHNELEQRVQERTLELARALELVQEEIAQRQKAEAGRDKLLRQIVHTQEEERRRFSRELHDNMGQHLTAILMAVQAIEAQNNQLPFKDRRSIAGNLNRLHDMVNELLNVSHRLAWEIRPAVLDNIGIKVALEEYSAQWSKKSGIKTDFVPLLSNKKLTLSPEAETALFRTIQEALTNVQRHSGASQVSIVMEQDEHSVAVIVEDNGRGLDLESNDYSSRLGILGMKERMESVGGTLILESAKDSGLTLYARIPLLVETR